jgi:sugar phosphate isomerase/epimerase
LWGHSERNTVMLLGLHTGSIRYTNVVTDIRIAKEVGYDAIELTVPKLTRYLDAGYQAEELLPALGSLRLAVINSFLDIERQDREFRRGLLKRCDRLGEAARTLGCQALQVVALNGLRGEPWPDIRAKIGRSLTELADIAAPFGVRLALEFVSFTPLRTLAQALEVLDVAGRDNVGLCLDTFHLWTGGTPWDEVAALDPALIIVAHLGDVNARHGLGSGPAPCACALGRPLRSGDCHILQGEEWSDADRDVLPGDGILPLAEGIEAIRATGYDGLWSVELLGAYHWEWDPPVLARELKRRAESLLVGS